MQRTIKKIYKSFQEKLSQQLQGFKSNGQEVQNSQNVDLNKEVDDNQQKIPSFFLLLLNLRSQEQLQIFDEHIKDPECKEKLKQALTDMIESYKQSLDTDIAVAFLKNVKIISKSLAQKKWGSKFIKESLIPSVFQMITLASDSNIDQHLIGKAIYSIDTCLGQNLSLSDAMCEKAQELYLIQKENQSNKFLFINVFPSLLEYLKFEQKQFLVNMFLQSSFLEDLPEINFKNIGEYLPTIKVMICPLQHYMRELAYFQKIDEKMKQREFDLLKLASNALFLKKVYQKKYFSTYKIHATHYQKGKNKAKIEKEDIINKIKVEGESCFQIFKILIKLIEKQIDKGLQKEQKQKLMICILECLFFYIDNEDLSEYKFKKKYINPLIENFSFIETNLIETLPLLFQNYSKILSHNSNFDTIEYVTSNFLQVCKLLNFSPQITQQIFFNCLQSDLKNIKESIYWLNQLPQYISYFKELNFAFDRIQLSKLIEFIVIRKPQIQVDLQQKINEEELSMYIPQFKSRQQTLDDYYNQIKQKSLSKKWRDREEAALQLKELITYMDIRTLFVSIVTDFFDLCFDKIAQVRTVAAWEVDSLFSRLPPRNPMSNIFYQALIDNVNSYYFSSSYQLRQVFVVMCASLMQKNSRIFLSYFSEKFISLAEDRVTNVRISVAKTIVGHLVNKMPLSNHKVIKQVINLIKQDKNKDVRNIIYELDLDQYQFDEEQEYDSKISEECSNMQLNKSEVDQFVKSDTLNMDLLNSPTTQVDPFDLLTDSTPIKDYEEQKQNREELTYFDVDSSKSPQQESQFQQQNNIDLIDYATIAKQINIFDDLSEDTQEDQNKIAIILEKEVEQEEKWPELQMQKINLEQPQQQQQQEEEKSEQTQQDESKSLTPIDLLDDLDEIFPSAPIQQKLSVMQQDNSQSHQMIQTIN
ncbi:hypothetical protein TTHERM_00143750 (macronuclear) [Tetrahymena thermophila SB210]|uniref:Uncharacterized protein n=1 Tax=Tetrahymena thermophila (strain SB210) TaxID=312017 RepID=I7M0S8_TETTS|nr:hypothetical protein TTHERM_00143750 [Tetrahymena thermophila SB210]EAR90869.1 hypothetical protein TTHERM_00143750 [Tetrahymena thermophila SB210]|eukprot:XP_001011114.1 hypothetical protein TTHERM_00143750 [Tetrahymena thermophila SB210]